MEKGIRISLKQNLGETFLLLSERILNFLKKLRIDLKGFKALVKVYPLDKICSGIHFFFLKSINKSQIIFNDS